MSNQSDPMSHDVPTSEVPSAAHYEQVELPGRQSTVQEASVQEASEEDAEK